MTTNTCPSWCEITGPHDQDHWRAGTYVPASRSHAWEADMNGATIPAIATHLSKARDESSTDIVLHIGGDERDEDFEIRLSIDDTIAHLSHAAAALVDLFAGKSRRGIGCRPADIERLDQSVRVIIDAYLRPDEQAKPIVYGEAEAAADLRRMTADLQEVAEVPASPGFFSTPDQRADYDRAVLEANLPSIPTFGLVRWTAKSGYERREYAEWVKVATEQDPLGRPSRLMRVDLDQSIPLERITGWDSAHVVSTEAMDMLRAARDWTEPRQGCAQYSIATDAITRSAASLTRTSF